MISLEIVTVDFLFAFLDDLYVVTTRERAQEAFDIVTEEVANGAGVMTHNGKLRLWSKSGGDCPSGFEDFDQEVWAGGAEPEANGVKVLGTTIGHADFVAAHANRRLREERSFLDKLPKLQGCSMCLAAAQLLWGASRQPSLTRAAPQPGSQLCADA